jgi:RNA polymerase sigma factor (sigma-70 family)
MAQQSDLELVRDFQNGKVEAFNELVRRYQQKVYWIARRMVGDHDEADDITQEVFLKVYKKLKDFRNDSSFYTWIFRITNNTAINVLRQKKIVNFLRLDDVFSKRVEIGDETSKPDDKLHQKENQLLLEKAITKLAPKQKKVFILRYYEEMPYSEISKLLKISIGGLKANYFHALKNIQKYVRENI